MYIARLVTKHTFDETLSCLDTAIAQKVLIKHRLTKVDNDLWHTCVYCKIFNTRQVTFR